MRKIIAIVLIVVFAFIELQAQDNFDEAGFLQALRLSYYTLNNTKLQNFIASVSSAKFDAFTKENWDTTGIPPIKIIWEKPDKIYISELKFPFKMNARQSKTYHELVNALKMQMKGILLDLQRFYLVGLVDQNLMDHYVLRHTDKAVQMTFTQIDNQGTTVKYLLGLNGLCIMIDISYPVHNKEMILYPEFKTVDGKWLCQGWTVQTLVNGQVTSGFKLTANFAKTQNLWLPESFLIEVQKADKKDKIFYDEIKMFDYYLNQNITITTKSGN